MNEQPKNQTPAEIKALFAAGKIADTNTPPADQAAQATPEAQPQFSDTEDFIIVLQAIRRLKRHVTAVPTNVPRNFWEQFVFYDDAVNRRLYVYVNGTWRYTALT